MAVDIDLSGDDFAEMVERFLSAKHMKEPVETPTQRGYNGPRRHVDYLTFDQAGYSIFPDGGVYDHEELIKSFTFTGVDSALYVARSKESGETYVIKAYKNIKTGSEGYYRIVHVQPEVAKQLEQSEAQGIVVRVLQSHFNKERTGHGDVVYVWEHFKPAKSADKLSADGVLTVENVLDIGINTALLLRVCNDKGIIHGDIAPKQILLKYADVRPDSRQIRIIDWDGSSSVEVARSLRKKGVNTSFFEQTYQGTLPYTAPEVFAQLDMLSRSRDMYAYGAMMAELLSQERPYASLGKIDVSGLDRLMKAHKDGIPPFKSDEVVKVLPGHVRNQTADLLEGCVEPNKNYRMQPARAFEIITEIKEKIGPNDASRIINKTADMELADIAAAAIDGDDLGGLTFCMPSRMIERLGSR